MLVTDLISAFVIAVILTIAFSEVFGRSDFRWRDVPLSFLLIVFASWAGGIYLVVFVPLLPDGHSVAFEIAASIVVFLALALIARPQMRASISAAVKRGGAAARFAIVLYFSVTLLLLFSAIVTRYAAVHLF